MQTLTAVAAEARGVGAEFLHGGETVPARIAAGVAGAELEVVAEFARAAVDGGGVGVVRKPAADDAAGARQNARVMMTAESSL